MMICTTMTICSTVTDGLTMSNNNNGSNSFYPQSPAPASLPPMPPQQQQMVSQMVMNQQLQLQALQRQQQGVMLTPPSPQQPQGQRPPVVNMPTFLPPRPISSFAPGAAFGTYGRAVTYPMMGPRPPPGHYPNSPVNSAYRSLSMSPLPPRSGSPVVTSTYTPTPYANHPTYSPVSTSAYSSPTSNTYSPTRNISDIKEFVPTSNTSKKFGSNFNVSGVAEFVPNVRNSSSPVDSQLSTVEVSSAYSTPRMTPTPDQGDQQEMLRLLRQDIQMLQQREAENMTARQVYEEMAALHEKCQADLLKVQKDLHDRFALYADATVDLNETDLGPYVPGEQLNQILQRDGNSGRQRSLQLRVHPRSAEQVEQQSSSITDERKMSILKKFEDILKEVNQTVNEAVHMKVTKILTAEEIADLGILGRYPVWSDGDGTLSSLKADAKPFVP